jgi:uncharacterized protein YwqG
MTAGLGTGGAMDDLKLVGLGLAMKLGYLAALLLISLLLAKLVGRRRRRRSPLPQALGEASRIRGRMTRMARPTLLLTPTKQPGFSKMGGEPESPADLTWPTGGGVSLAFLTQIDLTEVRAADGPDWLPDEGRLYAFYDDARLGFPDLVRIVYSLEAPSQAAPHPVDVPSKFRFPERRVGFLRLQSIPSLDWLGVDVRELSDGVDLDELADLPNEPFGDELQHRIGGYPAEIQEEQMALSCERIRRGQNPYDGDEPTPAVQRASKAWRLLLQVDSDSGLKMNWGDGGMLYVFIREQDARKGDFSQTVTIAHTY